MIEGSTKFTGVATAADLIERRQRSEFQCKSTNIVLFLSMICYVICFFILKKELKYLILSSASIKDTLYKAIKVRDLNPLYFDFSHAPIDRSC